MRMIQKLFFILLGVVPIDRAFALSSIGISGNPGVMTINSAVAGSNPVSVIDNSTTYSVLSIVPSVIVGQINSTMPPNVTLEVNLQAPLLATSLGFVKMNTSPETLVTGVQVLSLTLGIGITYRLSATAAASPVTNGTRILTLTIQ